MTLFTLDWSSDSIDSLYTLTDWFCENPLAWLIPDCIPYVIMIFISIVFLIVYVDVNLKKIQNEHAFKSLEECGPDPRTYGMLYSMNLL